MQISYSIIMSKLTQIFGILGKFGYIEDKFGHLNIYLGIGTGILVYFFPLFQRSLHAKSGWWKGH